MATLDFISTNPATEAFQRAEKLAQEREKNEQAMLKAIREESEAKTTWPTRLRRLEADTSLAETRARTAADEAPYAGPMARTRLRQANASALNTELQPFYKAMELLKGGDIEGANELARRSGHALPRDLVEDAEIRSGLAATVEEAKRVFPNRPRDQQTFIRGWLNESRKRREQGLPIRAPGIAYDVPNAPEPPETSSTFANRWEAIPKTRVGPDGKEERGYVPFDRSTGTEGEFRPGEIGKGRGGLGGGRQSVFEQKRTAYLQVHPNDEQGALDYASGRRLMTETEIAKAALSMARMEANADASLKYEPEKLRSFIITRAQEIAEQLRTGFAGPAKPPAPAVEDPSKMTRGDGGKPLDVTLPPRPAGVPPGAGYSPGKKMWFTRDGRAFDEFGQPVAR